MNNFDKTESKIRLLPEYIANQIAAGEVVQRPESVVKELVENSLDSGADSIAVIIRDAGKQLLHIVDNGSGMNREDLELAIKRHSTSKIRTSEDLERISTYGFRGEALASIAAVAQLEIRSRTAESDLGNKLIAEPNKKETIEPCSMDKGTQIFVRNLFYNVPARRKFLKSNLTEFRYISDTMLKFAISRSDIRFVFYDADTLLFDAKPETELERISRLFGGETAENLMNVDYSGSLIKVSGWVGKPHVAKATRAGQYFFLNKRSIQSRYLSHAVTSAYEHLLEKNSQPLFILFLEIDPERIDVNVHPQKHEVKFDEERHVYNTIHKAIVEALGRHNLAPTVSLRESDARSPFEFIKQSGGEESDMLIVNKSTGEIIDFDSKYSQNNYSQNNFNRQGSPNYRESLPFSQPARIDNASAYDFVFGRNSQTNEIQEVKAEEVHNALSPRRRLFQIHNKYIIYETESGMMIIDQHAAHERVLYERAVKAMNSDVPYSQELLFPIVLSLTPSQAKIASELSEDLSKLGYSIQSGAESNVSIKAVPTDVKAGYEESSLKEILDVFEEYEKFRPTTRRDNLAASYSCKAAIKTGQRLSQEEMEALLDNLFACETPYCCPHGRPVIIEHTITDLDKFFKRIL